MTPRRSSASFARSGVVDPNEEEVRDRRAGRLETDARGARRASSLIASRFERTSSLDLVGSPRRLASAASWPTDVTSNARRTLPIAVITSAGPTPYPTRRPASPKIFENVRRTSTRCPALEVLGDRVRVVRIVDVLEVRLVEQR